MEPTSSDPRRKEEHIRSIIDEWRASLARGEAWDEVAVIRCHPELMPELEAEIARWRHVVELSKLADSLTDPALNAARPAALTRLPPGDFSTVEKIDPIVRTVQLESHPGLVAGYRVTAIVSRDERRTVYDAVQLSSGRRVVVEARSGLGVPELTRLANFTRDAGALSELNHPHVIPIIDHGLTPGGDFYFATPFVDGVDLHEWIARHHLSQAPFVEHAARSGPSGKTPIPAAGLGVALRLFCQVCAPVNAAQLRGVLHRNLNPSNVRLDFHGNPFVVGFGLADLLADRPVEWRAWAAPEELTADAASPPDTRSDVYSLGVLLHQMIVGKLPGEAGASLPDGAVGDMIRKATQPRPEGRYSTVAELAREVRGQLSSQTPGRPDEPAPVAEPRKSRAAVMAATAAAAILLIVGLCWWLVAARNSHTDSRGLAAPLASHHAGTPHGFGAPSTRASTGSP